MKSMQMEVIILLKCRYLLLGDIFPSVQQLYNTREIQTPQLLSQQQNQTKNTESYLKKKKKAKAESEKKYFTWTILNLVQK